MKAMTQETFISTKERWGEDVRQRNVARSSNQTTRTGQCPNLTFVDLHDDSSDQVVTSVKDFTELEKRRVQGRVWRWAYHAAERYDV